MRIKVTDLITAAAAKIATARYIRCLFPVIIVNMSTYVQNTRTKQCAAKCNVADSTFELGYFIRVVTSTYVVGENVLMMRPLYMSPTDPAAMRPIVIIEISVKYRDIMT